MNLAIAIISAAIIAVLYWKKPIYSACLILFSLPVYLLRFSLLGIPFTVLETMILTLFVAFIVDIIIKNKTGKLHIHAAWSTYKIETLTILIFLAAGILSLIASPDLQAGLGLYKAYMIEPVLLFVVLINIVKSKKDLRLIFWALGLSALVISLIVTVQYFTGWGIPDTWHDWPNRRATGPYGFPNAVGLFIAPILTAFLGLLLHVKFFTKTNILWVLMIIFLMVFSLIATQVEGAIVAVSAGLFIMLLFTKWRWWTIGITLTGIGILILYEPTREILMFQDVSGDVRLALWQGTKNLLAAQPMFGAGLGAFPIVYDIYRLPSHVELLLYPHNIFLNFWVELGALGLAWLISVLFLFFYAMRKAAKHAEGFHLVLIGVMTCVLIYGLVDVPYFKNDLTVLFWTWLAIATILMRKRI